MKLITIRDVIVSLPASSRARQQRGKPGRQESGPIVPTRIGTLVSLSTSPGTPQERLETWRLVMTLRHDDAQAAAGTRTTTAEPLYGGRNTRRVTVRDIAAAKARRERWAKLKIGRAHV